MFLGSKLSVVESFWGFGFESQNRRVYVFFGMKIGWGLWFLSKMSRDGVVRFEGFLWGFHGGEDERQ